MVPICSSFEVEQYGESYIYLKQLIIDYISFAPNTKTRSRFATRVNGNGPLGNACAWPDF